MTTFYDQTVFSPWLTPVRVVSTANISGTYFNGSTNNGVGATYTIAASSLTIDSVVVNQGDRVLLQNQTSAFQNGIYEVQSIGSTVVLQRSADQQSLEQIKTGEYVSVKAGSVYAGDFFTIIEPIPAALGINNLVWSAHSVSSAVAFTGGPSTANALPVFSDTSGDIKAATTTATIGYGITAATGNLVATTGNLVAGSSGNAGTVQSFPATAANGSLILAAVNAGGAFATTISNGTTGQAQVVSIPDSGAATANFLVSSFATTQHITAGAFQVDAGAITSGISTGGFVGLVKAFPTTATSGFIAMQGAVNASGNFGTTLSNQTAQAQAQVLTFPDVGAATGSVLAAGAALVSGNIVQASGTHGAVVDSGVSLTAGAAAGVVYNAIVTLTAAQVNAAYAAPVVLVAAPGASQTIMVLNAQVVTEVSTAFTGGGVAQIQYGATVNAGGTIATSATIATAEITAASSQIFTMAPIAAATVMATATFKHLGLYFSNATQAFATGTGSTVTFCIQYVIIPSV